jgi:hypothetical protein
MKRMRRNPQDNMMVEEKEAMGELVEKVRLGEWAVRPADKGGGITVEKRKWIKMDANRELDKKDMYVDIEKSRIKITESKITEKLSQMMTNGSISKKMRRTMAPKNSRQGVLKLNRKIHKKVDGEGRYPWRAYVSGIGTATEAVAGLVEHEMSHGVEALGSYVRDSANFFRKNKGMKLGTGEFMFSLDVVALYPSVPRQGGEVAMRENIEARTDKTVNTEDLMELANLTLETNEITFENRQVVQIDGTAIGSKLGRNYACAFMGRWEKQVREEAVKRGIHVLKRWFRFVDDVFGVWRGSVQSLLEFVQMCNEWEPRIKITYEICMEEAIFLDVKVIRMEDGRTKTKLHVKETDRQRYLHVRSDHPQHTKTGIAKGQLKRLRQICSEDSDFAESARMLTKKMEARGYNQRMVEKEYAGIKQLPREEVLAKVNKEGEWSNSTEQGDKKINFVTTYSSYLPNVKQILSKNFHYLQREGL